MSRNSRERARLTVEELEGRQLLSAHVTSTLPVPGPAVTGTQNAGKIHLNYGTALTSATTPAANATTPVYAVLSLRNRTGAALHVQFRWSDQSEWSSITLPSGAGYYLWTTGYPVTPQVRLGTGHSTYTLSYNTVIRKAAPGWSDALHYNVARAGHTFVLSRSAT
jgi:hypothetical protein